MSAQMWVDTHVAPLSTHLHLVSQLALTMQAAPHQLCSSEHYQGNTQQGSHNPLVHAPHEQCA